jgi:hypothetical protein
MPTIRLRADTSGPPDSSASIAALVSSRPESCSVAPSVSSIAVMDWSRADVVRDVVADDVCGIGPVVADVDDTDRGCSGNLPRPYDEPPSATSVETPIL